MSKTLSLSMRFYWVSEECEETEESMGILKSAEGFDRGTGGGAEALNEWIPLHIFSGIFTYDLYIICHTL